MIRRLSQADHEGLMQYLSEEPSINLFMIGDVETFGYDSDFQDVWGQMDAQGDYEAVLLRFYQSYIVYAKGHFDVQGFIDIMNADSELREFSGKGSVTEQFEGKLDKLGKKLEMYFAELLPSELQAASGDLVEVKQASIEDMDRIIDIRAQNFSSVADRSAARKGLSKVMEAGVSRTFYTEDQGLMTSVASTTAENSQSAMIIAVCTQDAYRKQGLASKVMTALCAQVLGEGRTLCLFYNNPGAGAIYKRLGFRDIGMWNMYRG